MCTWPGIASSLVVLDSSGQVSYRYCEVLSKIQLSSLKIMKQSVREDPSTPKDTNTLLHVCSSTGVGGVKPPPPPPICEQVPLHL